MASIDRNYLEQKFGADLNLLAEINLQNQIILTIDASTFNGLSHLTKLFLKNNQLARLDSKLFNELSHLEVLELSYNQLVELDPNIFDRLSNLTTLWLGINRITSLNPNIFNELSANLSILELSFNQLNRLEPNLFDGLVNLTRLYLNNNLITHLDRNLFNGLTKLAELWLHDNQIDNIVDLNCFRNLNKETIRVVSLYDNAFKFKSFLKDNSLIQDEYPIDMKMGLFRRNESVFEFNEFLSLFLPTIQGENNVGLLMGNFGF